MNKVFSSMAIDMGIERYNNEHDDSYIYRVCYSALGLWCLSSARKHSGISEGTSKHNQTNIVNDLIKAYSSIYPNISQKFIDINNQQALFPQHIRRIYEETGYFVTDVNNRNVVANYGRGIVLGDKVLFFGIPESKYTVNGLGIMISSLTHKFAVNTNDFLIRDTLSCEKYLKCQFDPIDFYRKDIDEHDLEFFNPSSVHAPSNSWENNMKTPYSIARKSEIGPFYRAMRINGIIEFADEPFEQQDDSLTAYEYRRLYFALKAHYRNPLKAKIKKLDNLYSIITMGGFLPNREYYFLLLLCWPIDFAFNKIQFLVHNDYLQEISSVLLNIGVEIGVDSDYA